MDIQDFIRDSSGARVGRPDRLYSAKKTFLPEAISRALHEQWNAAGRDNARILARFTEADGSNPHYVTGWDGESHFVAYTETGLSYVSDRRLQKLKLDEAWDTNKRLVDVRTPLLRENMERSDVDALLSRVRQDMIKSSKDRREARFVGATRFFEADNKKKTTAKTPYKASDAVGAPQPAPKHPTGAPEKDPPGRKTYEWQLVDEQGKVKRRPLKHAKLAPQLDKREVIDTRTESVTCALCGTTRTIAEAEDKGTCAECGARETVDMRSEGGKWSGVSGGDGNKADPQLDKRELVDVRTEQAKVKPEVKANMGYWGDKVTDKEDDARENVDVRCEAFGAFKDKFKSKSPEGAMKPLFFMMLLKKGKKSNDKVEEGVVGDAASGVKKFARETAGIYKSGLKRTARNILANEREKTKWAADTFRNRAEDIEKPSYKLVKRPDEETERQEVDDVKESIHGVGVFKTENADWAAAHAHKFFSNMMKFKQRKKAKPIVTGFQQPKPTKAPSHYPSMQH